MSDYDLQQKVLHSPFSIDIHKSTFTNYLEVVIASDGTVMYAVPSHQEMLIYLACKKCGIDRDTLILQCPKEYYYAFMTWLSKISGACAVWNNMAQGYQFSEAQVNSLTKLKEADLYKGNIPQINKNIN